MNNILKIKNISKTFFTNKGEIKAIEDISLNIQKDIITVIVGSSGCGKSTLLNIIAGLDYATKGEILSDNKIKISYMFQEDTLLPWLTIYKNACLGLTLSKNKNEEDYKYVDNLLNTYGLKEFKNKYPKELSGGMKQKVSLIRALATKPDIILLDEPFSALDYQTKIALTDELYKIIKKENKSAIIITHDIAEAITLADEIVILSKRPSYIKKIYKIDFNKKLLPSEKRKNSKFNEYYENIWRNIDATL